MPDSPRASHPPSPSREPSPAPPSSAPETGAAASTISEQTLHSLSQPESLASQHVVHQPPVSASQAALQIGEPQPFLHPQPPVEPLQTQPEPRTQAPCSPHPEQPPEALPQSTVASSGLPGPSQPARTLNAMWGKPSSSDISRPALEEPTSAGELSSKPAATRKRRKKEQPAGQARLVFSAEGMSVATPPPEPAPQPKPPPLTRARNGQPSAPRKRGRGKQADPPSTANSPQRMSRHSSPHVIEISSDAIDVDAEPEVEVVATARGLGSQDDPVFVDETPRPKKIFFASEKAKPAHSFFSRPAPVSAPTSAPRSGAATPVAASAAQPQAGKVHAFFANGGMGKVGKAGQLKEGWGCAEGEESAAPWPGGEWPSHCGVEEVGAYEWRVDWQPRVLASQVTDGCETTADVKAELTSESAPQLAGGEPAHRKVHSPRASLRLADWVPPFILEHPAIAAVLADVRPDDARETWCERHRPRTAAAVLGNEVEATYLRDWLHALSVGSTASRRVVRRVPRKRLVNPDTAWIVDDIGMFGEPFSNDVYDDIDDEIPEPPEEPDLPLGARPDTYPPITNWVANTILLTGPSGSGKSAAVHAAATELGWNVFEVYPGIGRRTGPHLHSLVGDVGKNHMVNGEQKKEAKRVNGVAALFGAAVAVGSRAGSEEQPIELDNPAPEKEEKETRQSLILIDEADILFDERETFWPAVVALIAESRRPVVITCNDPGLIPIASLPLQTVLYFQPPPQYLAQAYLGAVAQRHSLSVDVAELYIECSHAPHPDLVAQPLPPNGHEPGEQFDLRSAINQMQVDRDRRCGRCGDEENTRVASEFFELVCQLETLSVADAHVAPRAWELLEVCEVDRLAPGQDDLDGVAQLLKPDVQELRTVMAVRSYAHDMAMALIELGGGPLPSRPLQYDQTQYVRSLLPLLDPLVPISARLLPDPTLFLSVVPAVRDMVHADDWLADADRAAALSGGQRFNRRGRAIRKAAEAYERWIDLDDGALQAARTGRLLY